MLNLSSVATYFRTGQAVPGLLSILRRWTKIFTFEDERINRLPRFLAITKAYKAGTPLAAIEAEHKCSRNTIHRYAKLARLPNRTKGFGQSKLDAVLTDYKAGLPIAKIALRNNVSEAYVSTQAKLAGCLRRPHK